VPLDLAKVYLATASSGKGLRSYAGISMVFYQEAIESAGKRLPRYLDLDFCARQQGIPFTFSSNLLHALHAAVRRVRWQERFAELAAQSTGLRSELERLGFERIGAGVQTSPAIVTIALPEPLSSMRIGALMQESGYLLSYQSEYLRRRNWIQICIMGESAREKLVSVVNALNRVCFRRRGQETPETLATNSRASSATEL